MPDAHHSELIEEMQRLRLDECTKDDLLDFVEKLLLFSEKLVSKVHVVESKLQMLEQKQHLLVAENEMLLSRIENIIYRARENPRESIEVLLQLFHDGAEKKTGKIN